MKNAAILVATLCMFWNAGADTIIGVPHRVKGPAGKVGLDGNVEPSGKADAVKKARAKKVSVEKLEIPDGSKHLGFPLDNKNRIDSLCGYELGLVVKVPVRPTLDDDGNILITQRLKKPFRKCTQATLSYSRINHALYGIKLFSDGDRKMTDDEAWQELENILDAIKAKFGDKVGLINKSKYFMKIEASMGLYSAQHFSLSARKVDLVKKASMKGTAPEKGWVFTVSFVDSAMHSYNPESKPAVANPPEGTDAL